ncbi:MAG: lipid-A-disaccharide synthase [Bacteroidota bacterium]
MKFFLVAGERSGDLHASRIVEELKVKYPEATFQGWGGDRMEQTGVVLKKHYRDTATMGFLEVLKKLSYFKNLIKECKQHITSYQPDAILFVDFSAFNLRVAPHAKALKIPVYYFITPKVWAWNTKRAFKLQRLTDHRLVILPFEVDFFQQRGIDSTYVGNPLTERIRKFSKAEDFREKHGLDDRPIMALLPGSRRQEVSRILPVLVELTQSEPSFQWVLSGVKSLPEHLYQPALAKKIPIVWEDSYNLMAYAHTAVVASGTATLETALFNVPQVVVYKTSMVSAWVVRLVIKIPFVSLPNLIAGREMIPEQLQNNCTKDKVLEEFLVLQSDEGRNQQLAGYQEIQNKLGDLDTPLEVAKYIANTLSS